MNKSWLFVIPLLTGCMTPTAYRSVSGTGTEAEFQQARAICNVEASQAEMQIRARINEESKAFDRPTYQIQGGINCTRFGNTVNCNDNATITQNNGFAGAAYRANAGMLTGFQKMAAYKGCMARLGWIEGPVESQAAPAVVQTKAAAVKQEVPNSAWTDYQLVEEVSAGNGSNLLRCTYVRYRGGIDQFKTIDSALSSCPSGPDDPAKDSNKVAADQFVFVGKNDSHNKNFDECVYEDESGEEATIMVKKGKACPSSL